MEAFLGLAALAVATVVAVGVRDRRGPQAEVCAGGVAVALFLLFGVVLFVAAAVFLTGDPLR
jgi:hypothetical protein